jgi:Ca2+/Na+ antiporter
VTDGDFEGQTPMDTFSACLAFGPLAIYLVLLGLINLQRRPLVISGTRETLSLGLALMGLVIVGPMQLFMPQEAATRFGQFVWILLLGFYVLCLTLIIILSRPRLVVYHISPEDLRLALDAAARRIDAETTWAGKTVSLPLARVHLHVESFPPLGNVALLATSDDQSASGWRRLELSLRETLRETTVAAGPHGFWMLLCGVLMLSALAFWVVDNPQTIAQGIERMLRP